jgi:hypothetical protein
MEETKLQEHAYSSESPAVVTVDQHAAELPSEVAPAETALPSANVQVPERQPGVYAPITVDPQSEEPSELADFFSFLKRTWRMWATAIAVIVGLVVAVYGVGRLNDMMKVAQLKRYDEAIAGLTPDRLIERCGQPAQDQTKEIFPVIMRTIQYKPWTGDPLVFAFSRTADQQGAWVFLTMKNEAGTKAFETPEAKIAAFSCLDSTK